MDLEQTITFPVRPYDGVLRSLSELVAGTIGLSLLGYILRVHGIIANVGR